MKQLKMHFETTVELVQTSKDRNLFAELGTSSNHCITFKSHPNPATTMPSSLRFIVRFVKDESGDVKVYSY